MTNTIRDITQESDVIMLVGSNPEEAHPVLGMQIRQAVRRGARLIVVDPRDIDLAKHADIHLKLRPGTNVAFANGMMHIIIEEQLQDREFIAQRTENYEALEELVREYPAEKAAEICGIDPELLREAARMYASAPRAPILYCLGVTEHSTGTEGVMSLSNLAMLCGKLGRPGCGVNPIRGQNNVQGACDMGADPEKFPGYQNMKAPGVLEKFETAWNVKLNPEYGTKATECFGKMLTGEIRGLFLFGEDPVRTDPDTEHVVRALSSLDFFVVDELFLTETAKLAEGRHLHQHGAPCAESAESGGSGRRNTARHLDLYRGHEPHGLSAAASHSGSHHGRDRVGHALLRRHQPRKAGQRRSGRQRASVALPVSGPPGDTHHACGQICPGRGILPARGVSAVPGAPGRRVSAAHDDRAHPVSLQRLRHDGQDRGNQ